MSESAKFFRFQSGTLVEQSESTGEPQLAVADSWLSVDGRSRSLQAHFERFAAWTAESAPELLVQLPSFFNAVEEALRVPGRLFPRIELHTEGDSGAQLFLRIREAPDQLGSIKLWSYPQSDPRNNPLIKGPDLSLCLQMRRNAQMHGADEAVITDARGNILEGALSAIVWWQDDVL
jgi:branched-subunit amino acid aminotransferase/4-amino-4-deoxychorismate lyase